MHIIGRRRRRWSGALFLALVMVTAGQPADAAPVGAGPLRVAPGNPRYFSAADGKPVVLVGAHTWPNFQDAGTTDPPAAFDYQRYLDLLVDNHLNFFRLWTWEQAKWTVTEVEPYWFRPLPYQRTGPGLALDGKPKFDLTRFDPEYFARLHERVAQAGKRGLYVSVMLFNGFSVEKRKGDKHAGNPWIGHPFNRHNNINGIDGDIDDEDSGWLTHTLRSAQIVRLQEAYVRKVVDTVNDLDNVLYEISNESNRESVQWQYHLIDFIKRYEASKPKQHPVGMTVPWPGGTNAALFASPADWVSPNAEAGNAFDDPAIADGSKVVLADTDHLCGICGDRAWAWKSFTRGLNPVFMDPYGYFGTDFANPAWVSLRKNLGLIRTYADRMRLNSMRPRPELASSRYCLADTTPDQAQFLVYLPSGGGVVLDLGAVAGQLAVEWLNPATGSQTKAAPVDGGGRRSLVAPFAGDAVLFLAAPPRPHTAAR